MKKMIYIVLWITLHHERMSDQGLKAVTETEFMYSLAFFPMLAQPAFPYNLRLLAQGCNCSQCERALPHQSLMKKMPHRPG